MSTETLSSLARHDPPVNWGRRLYFSMIGVLALLATYPAYNHWRIGRYEVLRQEITAAGGRAPRARGGSQTAEEIYWTALGGEMGSVVLRRVEFPHSAQLQGSLIARLRHCSELERLRLDGQQLGDEACRELFAMRQLEELRVCHCELSDDQLRGIEKLENLRSLDLHGTLISDASIDRLSRLQGLAQLNLHHTAVSPDGAARLSRALPQTQIQHRPWPSAAHREASLRLFRAGALLEVRGDPRQGVCVRLSRHVWRGTPQELEDVAQLHDVEMLELNNLDLEPELLASVARLPNIQTLAIASCRLREADLTLLGSSTSLRRVALTDIFLELRVVNQLADLPQLHSLALVNVRVVPGSLAALSQLRGLRELAVISVRLRGVNLDELAGITSLRKLDLVRIPIRNVHLELVAQMNGLESLGLNGTMVNDDCVPRLSQLVQLRRLDISNTPITAAGAKQIEAALPDCRVETQTKLAATIDMVDFFRTGREE